MKTSIITTIAYPSYVEIIEKKSRFIGQAMPVDEEKKAQELLALIRSSNKGAKHHAHAWLINGEKKIVRCSDDGEPNGTAGLPLLETIYKTKLQNIMIVVTRYFGGILLGTGNLSRIYRKTAQMTLNQVRKVQKTPAEKFSLIFSYKFLEKIEFQLNNMSIPIIEKKYDEKICFTCLVSTKQRNYLQTTLADLSNGTLDIKYLGQHGYITSQLPND